MNWMVKIVSSLAIFAGIQYLHAENISGMTVGVLSSDGGVSAFTIEEVVVIDAQTIPEHQEGLELKIELPESLRGFQNSFAVIVYKGISPIPDINIQHYNGTRIFMHLISTMDSMYLRIPFTENHSISGDALTYLLSKPVKEKDFPLLITILPIVKGLPEMIHVQKFTIRSSPIWKDEGLVLVSLVNPSSFSEEVIAVSLDGAEIALGETITVSTGLHKILVSSTHAPIVERTIAVESGKHINVPITLDYSPPVMTIISLEGARILLDGEEIEMERTVATLEITPGEHVITSILGDSETSRQFSIRPGGAIKMELIYDIKIIEQGPGSPFGSGD